MTASAILSLEGMSYDSTASAILSLEGMSYDSTASAILSLEGSSVKAFHVHQCLGLVFLSIENSPPPVSRTHPHHLRRPVIGQ